MCIDEKGTIVIVEFKKGPENPVQGVCLRSSWIMAPTLWGLTFEEFEKGFAETILIVRGVLILNSTG